MMGKKDTLKSSNGMRFFQIKERGYSVQYVAQRLVVCTPSYLLSW